LLARGQQEGQRFPNSYTKVEKALKKMIPEFKVRERTAAEAVELLNRISDVPINAELGSYQPQYPSR